MKLKWRMSGIQTLKLKVNEMNYSVFFFFFSFETCSWADETPVTL